jgi:hypothetical protein
MARRVLSPYRRALYVVVCSVEFILAACSGGGGDATAPDPGPPAQDPPPGPQQPPPEQQNPGVAGRYVLTQINNSQPGQMVTISNPDGNVIGIYRFDAATELTLDALQTFDLRIRYQDEKGEYGIDDQGEFKQAGQAQAALALTFTSAIYGDAFSGIVTDGVVAIKYDFDGDGQADTVFGFQRVG